MNLGLESIGTIIDGKSNKHVSAYVMEIFVDSLNSWMMKKVGLNYTDVYVMTSGDTYQLNKVVQVYTQMKSKSNRRKMFEEIIKEDIILGLFKNRVFSLMEDYIINGKELNWLIGVIYITNPFPYYVHFQIGLKDRVVTKKEFP